MDKKYISITDSRYRFALKAGSGVLLFCGLLGLQACTAYRPGDVPVEDRSTQADPRLSAERMTREGRSVDGGLHGETERTDSEVRSGGARVYPKSGGSRSTFSQTTEDNQIRKESALKLEKEYKEGMAIASLLKEADVKIKEGRLNLASSLLERALRIEPKNPFVWHKLASVRFKQKRWKLAESLAQKSYLFSSDDTSLQIYNWHLIASARSKQGDIAGARQARERAEQIAENKQ